MVALRLKMAAPPTFSQQHVQVDEEPVSKQEMPVWFDASGPVCAQVVDRRGLLDNERIIGPAVLWGPDATLLIPPGVEGSCDAMGTIQLETA